MDGRWCSAAGMVQAEARFLQTAKMYGPIRVRLGGKQMRLHHALQRFCVGEHALGNPRTKVCWPVPG